MRAGLNEMRRFAKALYPSEWVGGGWGGSATCVRARRRRASRPPSPPPLPPPAHPARHPHHTHSQPCATRRSSSPAASPTWWPPATAGATASSRQSTRGGWRRGASARSRSSRCLLWMCSCALCVRSCLHGVQVQGGSPWCCSCRPCPTRSRSPPPPSHTHLPACLPARPSGGAAQGAKAAGGPYQQRGAGHPGGEGVGEGVPTLHHGCARGGRGCEGAWVRGGEVRGGGRADGQRGPTATPAAAPLRAHAC